MVQFIVGSSAFFSRYSNFHPKDMDTLVFVKNTLGNHPVLRIVSNDSNDDTFYCKTGTKEELIDTALSIGLPMGAGKFLVPEVAEYLKLTVEDLKQLEPLFSSLDAKHSYEKLIYEAYLHNNAFVLTDKQRNAAYREYRKTRGYKT